MALTLPTRPTAPPTLEARAAMIDGLFSLPPAAQDAMPQMRKILSTAAAELITVFKTVDGFDYGTAVRAIHSLQEAKDLACQAVILPFYTSGKKDAMQEGK